MNSYIHFFHERYQDKVKYKNLMYGRSNTVIQDILKKDVDTLSKEEKIYFLFFIFCGFSL